MDHNHLQKEHNYYKEPLTDYQREFIYNFFKVLNEKPLNEIFLNNKDNIISKSILVFHDIHPQVLLNFVFCELDKNLLNGIINNEENLNFFSFFISRELNKKLSSDELDSFITNTCAELGWDESVIKTLFHEKKFKELLRIVMGN